MKAFNFQPVLIIYIRPVNNFILIVIRIWSAPTVKISSHKSCSRDNICKLYAISKSKKRSDPIHFIPLIVKTIFLRNDKFYLFLFFKYDFTFKPYARAHHNPQRRLMANRWNGDHDLWYGCFRNSGLTA